MRLGGHNCRAGLALAAALALGVSIGAQSARADGDPASDVLVAQDLFLPQDAGVTPARAVQLSGLLHEAAAAGFPIRVAIIDSSADLGSITELWRQPQSYARFLAAELGLVYRGPLLVVMPGGYGLVRYRSGSPAPPAALAGLPPPASDTAGAALTAVLRLAAADGHPLVVPKASPTTTSGDGGATPWLVFGAGLLVVLAAWGASLRARPLRVSRAP